MVQTDSASPSSKRLTLRYSLSRWDLFRWDLWLLLHAQVLWVFLLLGNSYLTWLDISSPAFPTVSIGSIGEAFILNAISLCGIVSVAQVVVLALQIWGKRYVGILGEHELTLTNEGVWERTSVNESLHRWSAFHRLVSSGNYYYLRLTNASAHVIPKACFNSDEEREIFENLIREYVRTS